MHAGEDGGYRITVSLCPDGVDWHRFCPGNEPENQMDESEKSWTTESSRKLEPPQEAAFNEGRLLEDCPTIGCFL